MTDFYRRQLEDGAISPKRALPVFLYFNMLLLLFFCFCFVRTFRPLYYIGKWRSSDPWLLITTSLMILNLVNCDGQNLLCSLDVKSREVRWTKLLCRKLLLAARAGDNSLGLSKDLANDEW